MTPSYLHVLWAANVGPLFCYRNPSLAFEHSRVMLGVEVQTVELRDKLASENRWRVHIVWTREAGPIDAFLGGGSAIARAARLRGAEVTPLEIRERLSAEILDDIGSESDFEGDEDGGVTPVDGVVVTLEVMDDDDEER